MVHYNENNLTIEFSTCLPYADHEKLMIGLHTALRLALTADSKYDIDDQNLIILYDLLDALTPEEMHLKNGMKQVKAA